MYLFMNKELRNCPLPCIILCKGMRIYCLQTLPPYLNIEQLLWYMFVPLELGCLLFPLLEPNLLSVYTIASTLQRRNFDKVEPLLETTTIPNLDQYAPDLEICLPLGLVALTTS